MEKESDESSVDYDFISKYIKEDSGQNHDKENKEFSKRFETRNSNSTEVFTYGEAYSYSEGEKKSFKNRYTDEGDDNGFESYSEEVESKSASTPVTAAKKEFLDQMQDESLSLDTASRITHDWGK